MLESVRLLLAQSLALVQTRLELITVELSAELQRVLRVLVAVFVALLFAALGMLMLAITVVIAVWDGHRLLAAGLLTAMFLGISAIAVGFAWFTVSRGPRLLEATLEELRRDQDALEGVGTSEGDQRQRKPHDAPQR